MFRRSFVRRYYRLIAARPLVWRRRWFGWGLGGCALMLMMPGCMSLAMFVWCAAPKAWLVT